MAVPSSDELQTAARREKPILETRSLDGSRPIVKTPYLNISLRRSAVSQRIRSTSSHSRVKMPQISED